MLIHQCIEAQAQRTPSATALAGDQGTLSYQDLNGRANQIGRYLSTRGVQRGSKVGICCERTFELVAGILGILKAGAAYVPMDPAYPADRLKYMAEAADLDLVLAHSTATHRLTDLPCTQVLLDGAGEEWSGLSCDNLDAAVGEDDLIYVIFTSGTTGRPKGAGVYHRGFSNLIEWFVGEFQINASDRVLMVSSPSFDLTQKNIFAPLATGGILHLSAPGPYDVGGLTRVIRDSGITLLNCTPSAFYPVVEDGSDFAALQSLRVVFLGGEPISLARLRPWFTSATCHAEIANTYGPTECTDICAFYRVTRENMDQFDFVPLGRAVTNVQLVVASEAMEPFGIGEIGELYVGGAGVGAGYINDPALTTEKFIANPFREVQGPRIYGTGDLVRWCAPGLLEFLGRKDQQVKVRGFRVELHEIESVLGQHPSVREAVVVLKESASPGGHGQLKAYFSSNPGTAPSIRELREFASSKLPEHMVPSLFEQLPAFPLSPNGKVDRNAVKALAKEQPLPATPEPRADGLQARIVSLWTAVLGTSAVGLDDNFFDVGGDSLSLTQLHTRLQKLVNREFAITEIFAHPTIRGQAEHFSGITQNAARAEEVMNRAQRQRQVLSRGRTSVGVGPRR